MKIELHRIPIKKLVEGYIDNAEEGVIGYGGKLDIRPPYQREFVYNEKQRAAVIDSILKDYPLNVMYWVVKDDGSYEVLDGQQRTISIGQYVNGDFAYDGLYFNNQQIDKQEQILNYEVMVYFCEGTDSERLDWFRIINIAGEVLTNQELLNATYAGPWVADARYRFSKTGCIAQKISDDQGALLSGNPIRQDYLETVLKWISEDNIEEYMGLHQHDENAEDLLSYFRSVIRWVRETFKVYRKEMKGLPWGKWYNIYKDGSPDPLLLEEKIKSLFEDEDVQKKSGIYEYVLTGKESALNIRTFSDRDKSQAYERQNGICPSCNEHFKRSEMEGDHIEPWHSGGKTVPENCQMLCRACNRIKGGR